MASLRTPRFNPHGSRRAFTLVELLVVVAIVGLILAIMLPAMASVSARSRAFRCQMSARAVAFDFGVFADDLLHGDRGNDEAELGPRHFRAETFQESQYGIDEFWRWGGETSHAYPDAGNADPMRCPEVEGELIVWKNAPCASGGVGPPQSVSFGFNARLHVNEVALPSGKIAAKPARLDATITSQSSLPLMWDVDGEVAFENGVSPVFSAPALDSPMVFADGRLWFPALRHPSGMNVAFVDGHVRASRDPLAEAGWQWKPERVK